MNNPHTLIIYHDNCNDGFGAATAAYIADFVPSDEVKFEACQYSQVSTAEEFDARFGSPDQRSIYVLDFSFPRPVIEHLKEKAARFVWLDHHKTAFEMWCGRFEPGMMHAERSSNHEIILDDARSGALIAWEYFHVHKPLPLAVNWIDDRDRWVFKHPGSREFHAGLALQPYDLETWGEIFKNSIDAIRVFESGKVVLNIYEKQIEKAVASACSIRITPAVLEGRPAAVWEYDQHLEQFYVQGLVTNTPVHISEVGNHLAKKSQTFGATWFHSATEKQAIVSLRSEGTYDVSAIAKAFGGGGHRNAAGFKVPVQTLLCWIEDAPEDS